MYGAQSTLQPGQKAGFMLSVKDCLRKRRFADLPLDVSCVGLDGTPLSAFEKRMFGNRFQSI